jgi:amino acid adenylation domain-containing protein
MVAGGVLEAQLTYWKQQLHGSPPTLDLPTDRPRPAANTFRGARRSFVLSNALTEALKALSEREGVTLFITLLAAFRTLLYRYTGQDDISIGATIANRTRTETEELIGFFVNMLVLRTRLTDDPSFRVLLRRELEVALGAYTHQDLPFELLVETLQPERDMGRTPLFQVAFVLHNAPPPTLQLPGLTVTRMDTHSGTTQFDLMLSMVEEPNGLTGSLEYSTDLFDAATVDRLIGHWTTLLAGIVAQPQARLSALPLLTAAERQRQFAAWQATQVALPPAREVHSLFESQVCHTPEAVAVIGDDQPLTYAALNARANQLAHYLRAQGVGPDVCVGLCVERSLELVVGVLGILKAGGAYVPLDPTYPPARLAFMLADAQVRVLVTQQRLVDRLPHSGTTRVCLDVDWPVIARQREDNPVSGVTADNLAYVIYTSGSTGTPKGVAMPHRCLWNLLMWHTQSAALPRSARTLQFAPLSFDVSFQELFATWSAGGTLVLISEDLRRDPAGLLRALTQAAIDRLFLPVVALQQLAEVAVTYGPVPTGLRTVITAGEQLQITRSIAELFSTLAPCTLHNHYGPSESHVVTAFPLTGEPQMWPTLPPIGWPIANIQIYVLDPGWQRVPVGVPGELYIGGVWPGGICTARR